MTENNGKIKQGEFRGKVLSDLDHIKNELVSIKKTYVTKSEFKPVKAIVFGMAGLILVAFATRML